MIPAENDPALAGIEEGLQLGSDGGELGLRLGDGHLEVAGVREKDVLEVPIEGGGVGLDEVGGPADFARTLVGPLSLVDPALERDAVEDDVGAGRLGPAGDEAGSGGPEGQDAP